MESNKMKTTKTLFIVCLLLTSIIIGTFPAVKASNLDSFGYSNKDSNTPSGPDYNWIEISETGTKVLGWNLGGFFANNIEVGFNFIFYGNDYNQLSIGNNGLTFFGTEQPIFIDNEPITNSAIHGLVAPYWDILYPFQYSDSGVYYETKGEAPNRMFIVEWYRMPRPSNLTISEPIGITFEAIFFEGSNNILFQYQDVEFGTSYFDWLFNNGISATVGIEDPTGSVGLEYSYNEPVLSSGLAILFEYPNLVILPNLYVSINAPTNMDKGELMNYTVSYCNLGGTPASNVAITVTLPPEVDFVSASADGIYDPNLKTVNWNIDSVLEYPLGYGTQTITIQIPSNTLIGTMLQSSASITSSTNEETYDDNVASVQTKVTALNLPENVNIIADVIASDPASTPIVTNREPITFTYSDLSATSVDISIHLNDGGPDITGTMTGPDPTWMYTLTFENRNGEATATFTAHHPIEDIIAVAHIEVVRVDPAGYIYDIDTHERISGATVWLQMPNGRGGWTNVPTGEDPAIMDPDVNPLTTGANGRYQWDTLAGTYRVHVQAQGYYSSDSIAVTVPPPVTDLHVGLVKIPLTQDNALPIVGEIITPTSPVQVNTPINFASSFTDADTLDQHSAIWVWDDGHASKGIVTESVGVGSITGARIYTSAGVYTETLTLTVTDKNGGSAQSTIQQYVVVYDPSAGFVTGGGWINSPAGAYPANPTLTGKANFGFVSKYQKGANVPSGNTEFDFRVAKLNFHGVSYDWLVIAGMKAQYKGSGTINGVGDYKFMLTAEDGANQGQDTFRIKIWDSTTNLVVYDNGAQSPLGGGNIIVHK
jgi:uncharacterized repeat protein (TIGR01451 family)